MANTKIIEFEKVETCRFLKDKKMFELRGVESDGSEAKVRFPSEALDHILNATDQAVGDGSLSSEELPTAETVMLIGGIEITLQPQAGLILAFALKDGRRVQFLLPSDRPDSEMKAAAEMIVGGIRRANTMPS
jgi:hypothetical protein